MLSYIDHVTLAVRDLDAAIEQFRERFSLVVGKKQVDDDAGLAHAVIPLLQGYIELLSPVEAAQPKVGSSSLALRNFLGPQQGFFSFAIRSSGLKSDIAALRKRGSSFEDPRYESAGTEGQPGWWVTFPRTETEAVEPYLIEHHGPPIASMRQAALAQPYAMRSIEEVTVVVANVDAALNLYARDFGLTPSRQRGGRAQMSLNGSKIMLLPSAITPLGTPLGLYSVSIGTTDINGARSQLRTKGIEFQDDPYSWSVVSQIDPGEVFGARLDLLQL